MPRKLKSWLESYLEFTTLNESPGIFNLWSGISVISATMGRKVVLDRGYYSLYPNLYVVLIAGSALCRKSTALELGEDFLKTLESPPTLLAQKLTPEAMISAMKDGKKIYGACEGMLISSELNVLLGKDSYHNGMLGLLTHIYGCRDPFEYQTVKRGKETVPKPWLGLFGASTPDWLKLGLPQEAIGGGFVGRVIFIVVDKTEKEANAIPFLTEELKELKENLILDLKEIAKLYGVMTMSQEANDWFTTWYKKFFNDKRTEGDMAGYNGRKHDTLLKIAMILCCADCDTLIMEPKHLQSSERLLLEAEKEMPMVTQAISATVDGDVLGRVLNKIKRDGTISYTKLMQGFSYCLSSKQLLEVLTTLEDSGQVRTELDTRGKRAKRTVIYTGEEK